MASLPPIDLIVLNWNAKAYLSACLSALQSLDYPQYTIIMVDNHSSDDSAAFVEANFPQVRVIRNTQNLGFAGGNNVALRRASAPIAVLVNPDVFVHPQWLRQLVQPMIADETIGVAGCKLYYPDGVTLQHAGGYLDVPQAIPRHYGIRQRDGDQGETAVRDVPYVIGASMALRRQMLERIGLLDDGFFLYFEDVDLCFRARQHGYRVVYVPQATAVHAESALTGKGSLAYLREFHTGRWRFLLKHYDAETLLKETVPAERAWLTQIEAHERRAAAVAYQTNIRLWPVLQADRQGESAMTAPSPETETHIAEALLALRQATFQVEADVATAASTAATPGYQTADGLNWEVTERPFVSSTPVVGKLIARFRTAWNNVAARWYVRPLVAQQNQFNQQVVTHLNALHQHLERQFKQQEARWADQNARLIQQDREQTRLIHDTAELTTHLVQMNRLLQSIETRLAHLEREMKQD